MKESPLLVWPKIMPQLKSKDLMWGLRDGNHIISQGHFIISVADGLLPDKAREYLFGKFMKSPVDGEAALSLSNPDGMGVNVDMLLGALNPKHENRLKDTHLNCVKRSVRFFEIEHKGDYVAVSSKYAEMANILDNKGISMLGGTSLSPVVFRSESFEEAMALLPVRTEVSDYLIKLNEK